MSRLSYLVKGLAALILLGALVAGIPWALWHFIGWPLPRHVPAWDELHHALDQHGIANRTLIDALSVVVWFTWAVLVVSIAVEIPAALSGRRFPNVPLAGIFQPATGRLVGAVIVAFLALAPRPSHSPAVPLGIGLGAHTGRHPITAVVSTNPLKPVARSNNGNASDKHSSDGQVSDRHSNDIVLTDLVVTPASTSLAQPTAEESASSTPPPSGQPTADSPVVGTTYLVQRGDTLWGIAQRQLGDPLRWSEIYQLNAGRSQPGGATLDDPHWIDPGWTLLLPEPTPAPPANPSEPQPATSPALSSPQPSTASTPAQPNGTPLGPNRTSVPPAVAPQHPAESSPSRADSISANHSAPPVRLPSGSVVAASFAAGALSALTLGRLRRRHAYRYRPPEPGRNLVPDPPPPLLRDLMTATAAEDSEDIDQDQVFNAPRPRLVEDDPGVRREPDRIDIGERNGRPISWSLSDLAGVTLSGSDALGVVRAWASALLVRAGPIGAEVLLTASVLDRLAPGSVATTGIRLASTAPVLLETLEAEVLARSRQLNDAEATDATGYRLDHPWDPLPATLAVVDAIAPIDRARWLPILSDAHRLGLGVIEMDGTTDTKARIELDDSNVVVSATPERLSNEFKEARLFSLGPDELHDVLATLDFAEQRPDSSAADEDDELGPISVFTRIEPIDSDGQHAQPAADVEADTWPRLTAVGPTSESAITVDVLGSLQITVASEVVSSGLRTPAKELLLWYLLRPEGASVEAAVEQLWPDTEPERVHKQFWIGASNLRTRLGAVADPPTKLLLQSGEIYRLDLDALGSDLWEFQAALDKAARSDDEALAGEWLRRAVECCRGEPFSGLDFPWIEPVRQDVHRRIVDAHLRLSEIEIRLEKPDAAVSVLEDVIEFDRYAEEPYRRLMTLQHDMGRSDALEATWRLLKDRLAEIDVDIERATLQLYRHLCAEETSQRDHQRVST